MKILILGARGCFGTSFTVACVEDGGIDLICPSRDDLDITEIDALLSFVRANKPDIVLNSVAIVNLDYCESNPNVAFAVHATPALHLAKLCEEIGIVYVQTSTHAVFDGTASTPYTEDDQPNPQNIYAITKWASEQLTTTHCRRHYVFRFPTMFGPRRNPSQGFADKVLGWLEEGRELRIADDKIDSPTYSVDAARAVLSIIKTEKPYGLYHISNAGFASLYDFVREFRDQLGFDNRIIRAKDDEFKSSAIKSLYTAFESIHLEPLRDWRKALSSYIATDIGPNFKSQRAGS